MDNNNTLFLVAFIVVIYFLFVRERENLEPEIPPAMPASDGSPPPPSLPVVVAEQVPPPSLPVVVAEQVEPVQVQAQPKPQVSDKMTMQEKSYLITALVPVILSKDASYEEYIKLLLTTDNKSKKLMTPESFKILTEMGKSGNIQVNVLYDLMNDV